MKKKTTKCYMATDQYGNTYHNLTHPRKDLIERIGINHADKMYSDTKEGSIQVGYVIGSHWCTVYEVIPMRRPA